MGGESLAQTPHFYNLFALLRALEYYTETTPCAATPLNNSLLINLS